MKAAFVAGTARVGIRDDDDPRPGSGDVLVEMRACGICGSDVEKVFGSYGQPSRRLGHEPAGIVKEIGEDVREIRAGDRVFAHHHVPCYSCHYCSHGNETMCPKYYETNLVPCGLAEKFVVPEWNVRRGGLLKLPDSVSFEEASLIEPLACCTRSWNKLPHQHGDSVAVYGIGSTGMMHTMLAIEYGFENIFCLDVNQFRLDFAQKLPITGAMHAQDPQRKEKIMSRTKIGVDVAIVSTGSLAALKDAISMLRRGGTLMMFGVPSAGDSLDIDMSDIYSREITISTSYAASDKDTKAALDMINNKTIPVRQMITHRYELQNSHEAFEHAHSGRDAMKIIITN